MRKRRSKLDSGQQLDSESLKRTYYTPKQAAYSKTYLAANHLVELHVRTTEENRKRIQDYAAKNGMSVTQLVLSLLAKAIEDDAAPPTT